MTNPRSAAPLAEPEHRDPEPPVAGAARPRHDDPLERYKAALRERFPGPDEIFREAEQRQRARRAAVKAGAAIGTSTAAAAVLAACLWFLDPAYRTDAFATAAGETATHTLADTSTVTLNTGTTLEATWHLRSRRLQLKRGEAMFSVAHGARDFTVQAGDTIIRDIGTAFNVRLEEAREDSRVTVAVVEGAVEVRRGAGREVRLTTGQTITAGPAGLERPRAMDLAPLTAWQRGKLVFDGTSLDLAVAEMRRYRAAPIVLEVPDAQAAALRLSGEFDHQRIDALLDLLPTVLPLRVRRLPDGQVVIAAAAMAAGRAGP
ncbi:FecR domain-containing protein [Schlegelella sp. S2-27]|uniref:FecR domain-containing protein n=1 Tax=Caldimonas mangrovi TaxID=2944811 RepID=A0ABT0YM06_9BURK|nr:FecR domain-containing protein [Caldimonas mangrovi]MCM5679763.1 FecR domain-containing protein [Caldimonas mangrovi]